MKKKIFLLILLVFFISPVILESSACIGRCVELGPDNIAFNINILSSFEQGMEINYISKLMEMQLPKIGIGISMYESTIEKNIAERTYYYPLIDYDFIPTYPEGGFDVLIYEHQWDIDWEPTGFFDSSHIPPFGENYVQYSNPYYDQMLTNLLLSKTLEEKSEALKWIQTFLYEDLPSISIVYPRKLLALNNHVLGGDGFLVDLSQSRTEFWDSNDQKIVYCQPEKYKERNCFNLESSFNEKWISSVYGSLYQRSQVNHTYEPIIASNYSISDDGFNVTVFINPEARFSNGDPVLTEDIEYSYQLYLIEEVNSKKRRFIRDYLRYNNSIEIISYDTIVFHFNRQNYFPEKLLSLGLIDKSTVEPLILTHGYNVLFETPFSGNVSNELITSCGPFIVDHFSEDGKNIGLIPNPNWIGKSPSLNQLNFTQVTSSDDAIAGLIHGDFDIMDTNYEANLYMYLWEGDISSQLVKTPSVITIDINMRHPVIGTGELTPVGSAEGSKDIRKAISHAIPRGIIVDYIFDGLGAPGITPMPDVCFCFDNTLKPYAYDLDLARGYVRDGGFECYCIPYTETAGISTLIMISFLSLIFIALMTKKIKQRTE